MRRDVLFVGGLILAAAGVAMIFVPAALIAAGAAAAAYAVTLELRSRK